MSRYHVCVWIDHGEARIFAVGAHDVETDVVHDHGPVKHIHRKADHVGLSHVPAGPHFLDEVAAELEGAKALLICGPGQARNELAGYLNEHYPVLAKRVWGIEPMDHPTDGQVVADARRFFRAADRMHA